MRVKPNSPRPVTLQALATLPGEPEVSLADVLAWSLNDVEALQRRLSAALRDLSDVRSLLQEFQHIAKGGSPRLASEITKGGD